MLMKKIFSYLIICICCFGMFGCGSMPNLSAEDMDLVSEYAAGLLLKYSAASDNRLMDMDEAMALLEEETKKQEVTEEEPAEEPVKEAEEPEVNEEPTPNDTPVIDKTEETDETIYPINDCLGVDLLTVDLSGYELKDSYPDGSGAFFALDAKAGNKLLVLKCTLTNNTDSDVSVNMLEKDVTCKVSLDGNGYKNILSTMLLDDLSTYMGTLSSGASVDLVLLSEWKEEDLSNITNLSLYAKCGEMSGTYTVE